MATETGEGTADSETAESEGGLSPYMRGVTVTTTATLSGIAAALISVVRVSDPGGLGGLVWLAIMIAIQFPFYRAIGIDTGELGAKDYLYVGFMTFTLWFISWGILLTAGV